jgi:formate-dependent nitrite reductase cytochrome c552 subunit
MWSRGDRGDSEVTCIACDATVPRSSAREYDKHGDRWERAGKEFECLCKECHRELCHQPRDGLEDLLAGVEADDQSRDEFLAAYVDAVRENADTDTDADAGERER